MGCFPSFELHLFQVDFIYYTGGLPPHNVWNQSRTDQIYSINTINEWLATIFPNKTFYSAVGNHEAGVIVVFLSRCIYHIFFLYCKATCNLYPTPNIRSDNISWLYEVLADSWIKLGLSEDTRDSILRGAFYTTIVRPGLRLISNNMNYCPKGNDRLLINSIDPCEQLQWVSFLNNTKHTKTKKNDSSSWFNSYNILQIMKKKFILLDIIHHKVV